MSAASGWPDLLILVPSALERERLDLPDELVAVCGVGLVAAALGTARLLAERRPARCWLAGIAGTRDPERVAVGALVVGASVRNQALGAGHGCSFRGLADMGLADEADEVGLWVPEAAVLSAAGDALEAIGAGGAANSGGPRPAAAGVLVGTVGTVAATSEDPDEAAGWHQAHPDVLVEEMEGYAVALAARAADVPLGIVRGVSNVAGDRNKARWDIDGACAGLQAFLGVIAAGSPGTGESRGAVGS